MTKPPDPVEPRIDFAILTAIEVERKAVCAAFGLSDKDRVQRNGRWYWRGKLPLPSGWSYEIVVAQPAEMGQVEATALATEIAHLWNPRAALMVGIAASTKPDEVKLGDVVIGRSVYYYEHGKVTPKGTKPQPEMIPADSDLLKHFAGLADWDGTVLAPRPDGSTSAPTVFQGVLASGDKVIAHAAARDAITSGHRKILGLEMEGYGFSRAIWLSGHIRRLVIRGISDNGSSTKNDAWHAYAAAAAAGFAKHFLLDLPTGEFGSPPPRGRVDTLPSEEQTRLTNVREHLINSDSQNRTASASVAPSGTADRSPVFTNGPFAVIAQIGHACAILINRDPFTIGRMDCMHLIIPDPRTSRHHAVIERHGKNFIIENMSSNGTFVNGIPINRYTLRSRDVIRIAGARLLFTVFDRIDEASAAQRKHVAIARKQKTDDRRGESQRRMDEAYIGNGTLLGIARRLKNDNVRSLMISVQIDNANDIERIHGTPALNEVYAAIASRLSSRFPSHVILASVLSRSTIVVVVAQSRTQPDAERWIAQIERVVPHSAMVGSVDVEFATTVDVLALQDAQIVSAEELGLSRHL